VRREGIDAAVRIAVASAALPRLSDADRTGNRSVLQEAADRAAGQVRTGLAGARAWTVLDAATLGGGKPVQSFGKVSEKDLAGLFPRSDARTQARDAVLAEQSAWNKQFIAAEGLPVVPREALVPDEEATQKDPAVRAVMLQQAGQLCRALNVDAVAFAHLRYAITHPRESAFIVTDDRTDGMLALSATLVIVDKNGTIIADMGVRPIGRRSRSRDLLPVYRGAGRDAVKNGNIDLADPKKIVQKAFLSLVDETVADLMDALKMELKK
jgi:hypothetical protein